MTEETILTDDAIHNLIVDFEIECDYGIETTPVDNIVPFSRAIEQAVLQSPEVQALKRDKERLNWLEAQTKKSYTGISFDYNRHVEDGYVVDHGYRFIGRYLSSGYMDSLRKAIDAAMENEK